MPKKSEVWEKVGVVGVDAGMVWVGDPCYIIHANPLPKDIGANWGEFCAKFGEGQNGGWLQHRQFDYDGGHAGLGVTVESGEGDGCYPVLVRHNDAGRIAEVRVIFINDDNESEGNDDDEG